MARCVQTIGSARVGLRLPMIGDMSTARIRHALAPNTAVVMLVLTVSGLSAGLVLHAAGASQAGNGAWLATGLLGAGYGLWAVK
jgi:hypothetical protein